MIDADQLEQIAQQLAGRVRDDDPEANARWLTNILPDPADWFRLAFALAAAVPDDKPWTELVAWHCGLEHPLDRRRRQWRESQQSRRSAA